jgi:hypothetical protein
MATGDVEKKLDRLIVAVCGHPDIPEDSGLFGSIKEIEIHLKSLNDQVSKNSSFRKIGTWIAGAFFTGIICLLVALLAKGG